MRYAFVTLASVAACACTDCARSGPPDVPRGAAIAMAADADPADASTRIAAPIPEASAVARPEWARDAEGRLRHWPGPDAGPLRPAAAPSCDRGGGACVPGDPSLQCGMTYVGCSPDPAGGFVWKAVLIPPPNRFAPGADGSRHAGPEERGASREEVFETNPRPIRLVGRMRANEVVGLSAKSGEIRGGERGTAAAARRPCSPKSRWCSSLSLHPRPANPPSRS